MRKRRKTRYEWLPNEGTIGPPGADVDDTHNGVDFGSFANPTNGTTTLLCRPLIVDEPSEQDADKSIGSRQVDYILKRVVGKWWIQFEQIAEARSPQVLVGAGLFVAKCNDPDSGLSVLQPVGIDVAAGATVSFLTNTRQANAILTYSPLSNDPIQQPWIWRRTWIFENKIDTTTSPDRGYPRSTAEYGSVADGPHMDARTARRIRDGERLWAVIAVRSWPINTVFNAGNFITGYLDYRALGALRKHRQQSAF